MLKSLVNFWLRQFGREVILSSRLMELTRQSSIYETYERWISCPNLSPHFRNFVLNGSTASNSQLQQDLVAQYVIESCGLESGFFVEFGACDGLVYSNSFLLESQYGWTGILAEPGKTWHEDLVLNRQASIDFRCVSTGESSEVEFFETSAPEYSTINLFRSADNHRATRVRGIPYQVPSVSLGTLLEEHNAPVLIDYLSIDTEGSEFAILNAFDFSKYMFRMISVEHNFSNNRELIQALLTRAGYVRALESLSQFEDWYFPADFGLDIFYQL